MACSALSLLTALLGLISLGSGWRATAFVPGGLASLLSGSLPPRCTSVRRFEPRMILAVPKDIRNNLAVGDVVIPVAKSPGPAQQLLKAGFRKQMAQMGLYAGVEYRVVGIALSRDAKGKTRTTVQSIQDLKREDWGRLTITMRPLYRLTNEFERKWPIEVAYGDLPTLLSPPMYNAATLLSTLGFSAVSLTTGFVGRTFISLCYIPSHSMYPSIEAGDLIVVEGVSHYFSAPKRGEIVAFKAPAALEDIVEARGEHLDGSEKFVKRVGCVQGDRVLLRRDRLFCQTPQHELVEPPGIHTSTTSLAIASAVGGGRAMTAPQDLTVPDGMAFVVGDNPGVSVDSRVWGCVPRQNIVGRPIFRLFPLSRFGPIY